MPKILFYLALVFFLFNVAYAQTTSIRGKVRNKDTNEPIASAVLNLIEKGNTIKKRVLTSKNGDFIFEDIKLDTSDRVDIVLLGYRYSLTKITAGELNIFLVPDVVQLSEVTVKSSLPIVRQELDRIIYDVQQDFDRRNSSVLEVMQKVPFLSLGSDDNLLLKGNSNFKVLIDGKPSPMASQNPSLFLRSLNASSIKTIEVFPVPPSKFDGEGLGGIINIITQKKIFDGYNGSIGGNFGNLGNGSNGNINLKNRKFGVSSMFSQLHRRLPEANDRMQRTDRNGSDFIQSGMKQGFDNSIYGTSFLSLEMDSLNLITLTGSISNSSNYSNAIQYVSFLGMDVAQNQTYTSNIQTKNNPLNFDVSINYQLGFKNNKDQLLTFSYQGFKDKTPSTLSNNFSNQVNSNFQSYGQINNTQALENNFQIDYVSKLNKLTFELGGKYIGRENESDFTTTFSSSPNLSNVLSGFSYIQRIFSGYNTYSLKLKKWGFKAGLRFESTAIEADFNSIQPNFDLRYSNVLPSLVAQYKLNGFSNFRVGYSKRIQRPGVLLLNPFVNIVNPSYSYSGNPDLKPVDNHKIEFGYNNFKKASIIVDLTYIFTNNPIQNVTVLDQDSVSRTTYQNIGKRNQISLNTDFTHSLSKQLRVKISGSIGYITLKGRVGDVDFNNDGIEGLAYGYMYYKFNNGLQVSLNAGYAGQSVRLQGLSSGYFYNSIGVSKSFFKDKLYSRLNFGNPFKHLVTLTSSLEGSNFIQRGFNERIIRSVNLSMAFSFGKLKDNIKSNKRNITNDDKVAQP